MTNGEFYKDKLLGIKGMVAIADGEPCACENLRVCELCSRQHKCRDESLIEWLFSEHIEETNNYKICKKLKVDDKILVSRTGDNWKKRHYAGYDSESDCVFAFDSGGTSWSVDRGYVTCWKFVKLSEEETND